MVIAQREFLYEEFIRSAREAGLTNKEHFYELLKAVTREFKTYRKSLCKIVSTKFLPSHFQPPQHEKFTNLENYTPINYFLDITGSDPHLKKMFMQRYKGINVHGHDFVKFPDEVVSLLKQNKDMFYCTRSRFPKTIQNKKKKLEKELEGEDIDYAFVEIPVSDEETALYIVY